MLEFAYVRNMFSRGICGAEELSILKKSLSEIKSSKSIFKDLIINGIQNCLEDIKIGKLSSATVELHFIHNFPITPEEYKTWDERHFYTIELMAYLEETNNVERIKKMIQLVSRLSRPQLSAVE